MVQFVDFPNQLTVDELLDLAKARQLSMALDMVFKALEVTSPTNEVEDDQD